LAVQQLHKWIWRQKLENKTKMNTLLETRSFVSGYICLKIPEGLGESHIKRTGVLIANFEKTPKRYQGAVLWAWLKNFSLLGGTNSKTPLSPISFFFWLNTL